MTKVELFELIRIDNKIKGKSIRAIAKERGIHRRMVRQALANAVPPERKKPGRPCIKLNKVRAHIDRWLEEDKKRPKKQRHTAVRIYKRLRDEYGADISESTVRNYVARKKKELGSYSDVSVPQVHLPGKDAEVDFYEALVEFEWGTETVQFFNMRASYSAREFHRASPLKNQQAFLEGHVHAFNYFGGVFENVRYDNLTPAVKKILRGRRRHETEKFIALRSHYLFNSQFCQPGIKGAHEKGGVEGSVGRFRRNNLVPVPKAKDYEDLNNKLLTLMAKDDLRTPQGRDRSVQEMFEMEIAILRPLPNNPFDTNEIAMPRVDAKSRIKVKGAHYSVPAQFAGFKVEARVGATKVDVYSRGSHIATHARKKHGEESLKVEHYIDVFRVKPGSFEGSKPLYQLRQEGIWPEVFDEIWGQLKRRDGKAKADKEMIEILALIRKFEIEEVASAARLGSSCGILNASGIYQFAQKLKEPRRFSIDVGELNAYNRKLPNTDEYDILRLAWRN